MLGAGSQVELVGGAPDTSRTLIEDVGIDLRGAHVAVTQQLLDGADVATGLEQVRRE